MKKTVKIIALLSAVILLALSLCSCRNLDSMRAHQAVYTDESEREILLDGNTYKIFNTDKLDIIYTNSFDYDFRVTSKDVPVLISFYEGDFINVSDDKKILVYDGLKSSIWYVREDVYSDYENALKDVKLDHYYMNYQSYANDDEYYAHDNNILLDDDTTEIINKTLSTPEKDKISYTELSKGDYSQEIIYIKSCDEKMMLTDNVNIIYITKDSGKYYIWDGNTYNEKTICPVAEEDAAIIKKLYDNNPDAVSSYNIGSYFVNGEYYYDEYYDEPYYSRRATGEGDSDTV